MKLWIDIDNSRISIWRLHPVAIEIFFGDGKYTKYLISHIEIAIRIKHQLPLNLFECFIYSLILTQVNSMLTLPGSHQETGISQRETLPHFLPTALHITLPICNSSWTFINHIVSQLHLRLLLNGQGQLCEYLIIAYLNPTVRTLNQRVELTQKVII